MAKNISLLGADYPDVPAVVLPKTGGGTARFVDTDEFIRTISSGSLHDITASGLYYITGSVTDKPVGNGGLYIVTAYNTQLLVGKYISTSNEEFNVIYNGGTWNYQRVKNTVIVPVTGTTTASGAIAVPAGYSSLFFVNALITSGGPGYVIRRDAGYFTVFTSSGTPMANTAVEFDAMFMY